MMVGFPFIRHTSEHNTFDKTKQGYKYSVRLDIQRKKKIKKKNYYKEKLSNREETYQRYYYKNSQSFGVKENGTKETIYIY